MTDDTTALQAIEAELAAIERDQREDDEGYAAHKARRRERIRALKRARKALGGEA